ncbi:MAG: hypothetical protein PHP95_04135 [Desulfuromonadaceae bacterium]|nr:hypothetical protein [Desulfuromonadaceae bacterium]MDD2847625.1 hypothetical protein [Desulfuromonadaceae bacterium]MDD4131129.1 hypothetical protein [Desulfuromonadaceae bacterium]
MNDTQLNDLQLKRAEKLAAFMLDALKDLYDSVHEYFEDEQSIPEPILSKYIHAEYVMDSIVEGEDDSTDAHWGHCSVCELPNVGPGECGNCD